MVVIVTCFVIQVDDEKDLVEQAEKIRQMSIAFAKSIADVFACQDVNLYMHYLIMHVPDMIKKHGYLVRYGGQGTLLNN